MSHISIQPEATEHVSAIRDVNLVAFQDHPHSVQTEHLIVEALREAGALAISLVALSEGRVVGHIAFSPATVGERTSGWFLLGPLAVLPDVQGRGIGSLLVRAGLAELRLRGASGCVLVGDPGFYGRFGFGSLPSVFYDGVPGTHVLCLPLSDDVPPGAIKAHAAFSVGVSDDRRQSEREKMLRGEPYDASDDALVEARTAARRLTTEFNAIDPGDPDGSRRVLGLLLGEVGEGCWVEAPFHCDYGSQVRLGDRVYVNMSCIFLDAAPITLGDDVQLGPGVSLLTSDHPRDAAQRAGRLESALPISIGARSWLGGGVIVLPGVTIGSDVVIGAGSVVTRPVPSGVTAAGNPCRVISGG